jgi:hypothetical protein
VAHGDCASCVDLIFGRLITLIEDEDPNAEIPFEDRYRGAAKKWLRRRKPNPANRATSHGAHVSDSSTGDLSPGVPGAGIESSRLTVKANFRITTL